MEEFDTGRKDLRNIYRKTVFGQNFLADVGRRNELKNLS